MIKSLITAGEGYTLLTCDYSSVESRILAYVSGDESYIDSVNSTDFHRANAAKMLHKPPELVTKDERSKAKVLSFSIPYGTSAIGLFGQGIGANVEEAEELINDYFKAFPKVKKYLDSQVVDALTIGYTQDVFGRLRWYEIPSSPPDEKRKAEKAARRQAQNFGIQSCKYGEDLIFVRGEGFVKIKSLEGKDIEFWDGESWSTGWVKKSTTKKKALKVVLDNGMWTISSPEHLFKTTGWTRADELVVGTQVEVSKEMDFPVGGKIPLDIYEDKTKLGVFLGRLSSEGYISDIGIRLGFNRDEIEVAEYLELESLGFTRTICYWGILYTLMGTNEVLLSFKNDIPNWVTQDKEVLKGYLSGFIDGLATVEDGLVKIPEHPLIQKIQILLLGMGVHSTWENGLSIRGFDRIGFPSKDKNSALNKSKNEKSSFSVKEVVDLGEEIEMYDIMDSTSGQFCGNGIVVHNCSASVTKMAIRLLGEELAKTGWGHMVLTIHDSIFFEIKTEYLEVAIPKILSLMEDAGHLVYEPLHAPSDADVGRYELRTDKLTGKKFYTYEYLYQDGKVIPNPECISEDTEKALKSIGVEVNQSDLMGTLVSAGEKLRLQPPEWIEENRKLYDGVFFLLNQ